MKKNVMMLICCLFLMVAVLIPVQVFGSVDSLNVVRVNSIPFTFNLYFDSQMAMQGERIFITTHEWDFSNYHLEIFDPSREWPLAYRDNLAGIL